MNSRWYQWLTGKFKDEVEEVKEVDGEHIIFKSGNKIKKEDMDDEMKPVGSFNDIDGNVRFNSAKFMDGILQEDLEQYSKGENGVYSMGQAKPAGLLTPEEEARLIAQAQAKSAKAKNDAFLAGIPTEDEVSYSAPAPQRAQEPKKSVAPQKNAPKQYQPINEIEVLINNARKEDVELELSFKAKIPVKAFFGMMDDAFLRKNSNQIIAQIIERIKTNELEKQLKAKVKTHYGLK